MTMPRYEVCPFCEASFKLVGGHLPKHLDVFRTGACPGADKTLTEAEKLQRDQRLLRPGSELELRTHPEAVRE